MRLLAWCGRFIRDVVLGALAIAFFILLMTAAYVIHHDGIDYLVKGVWAELHRSGVTRCPIAP